MRVCCRLTSNSIQLHPAGPRSPRRLTRQAAVRRDRAGSDRRPKMQEKSKQIYLLKEDSPHDCHTETSSSCGRLGQVLSLPLMWHLAIYDFLMTLFYTILFAVLFNNFAWPSFSFRINLSKGWSASHISVCPDWLSYPICEVPGFGLQIKENKKYTEINGQVLKNEHQLQCLRGVKLL